MYRQAGGRFISNEPYSLAGGYLAAAYSLSLLLERTELQVWANYGSWGSAADTPGLSTVLGSRASVGTARGAAAGGPGAGKQAAASPPLQPRSLAQRQPAGCSASPRARASAQGLPPGAAQRWDRGTAAANGAVLFRHGNELRGGLRMGPRELFGSSLCREAAAGARVLKSSVHRGGREDLRVTSCGGDSTKILCRSWSLGVRVDIVIVQV